MKEKKPISPAEAKLLQQLAPAKRNNTKSKAKETDQSKEEPKAKKNRYCRVNLALHEELGEKVRAEAQKQNRSMNNLIETILNEYFNL